ncbi:MAG: M15 family metallopeptidase [Steroidobacteraceae bacterium]
MSFYSFRPGPTRVAPAAFGADNRHVDASEPEKPHDRITISSTMALRVHRPAPRPVCCCALRSARAAIGTVRAALLAVSLAAALAGCAGLQGTRLPPYQLESLRAEALRALPPDERGDYLASDLVEVATLDPSIRLDVRYATSNNFLRWPAYSEARVFLQRPAAEAVVRAHRTLEAQGYGLVLFDGYRPWYVTRIFWDATPPEQRAFVADPAQGSRHNRGCAVDLTLYERATGREVRMPSGYDEFSERAHPGYAGGSAQQRTARDLLRRTMEMEGFTVYENEWWHFDCHDWNRYRIGNTAFKNLP